MLLIADDYSLNPGINKAILSLIKQGVLQGTSCMTLSTTWHEDASQLKQIGLTHPDLKLGLHLTLTGADFLPLVSDIFSIGLPTKEQLLIVASLGQLDQLWLEEEIEAQLEEFERIMGGPPDFIDGHEHVHLFPAIRSALLSVLQRRGFEGWVRQCGGPSSRILARPALMKSLLLELFSRSFRAQYAKAGIRTNDDFTGLYSFGETSDYASLMLHWQLQSDEETVCMCHPGLTDPEDHMPDPILSARKQEYAYLLSIVSE